MAKALSKTAQKSEDHRLLIEKIHVAMKEAEDAAIKAFEAFATSAKRSADGHIADSCGGAYLYCVKPSYHFRVAMIEAGAMERSFGGRWDVGQFQHVVNDQSVTGADIACKAALTVLQKHFPDESLSSTSYLS